MAVFDSFVFDSLVFDTDAVAEITGGGFIYQTPYDQLKNAIYSAKLEEEATLASQAELDVELETLAAARAESKKLDNIEARLLLDTLDRQEILLMEMLNHEAQLLAQIQKRIQFWRMQQDALLVLALACPFSSITLH